MVGMQRHALSCISSLSSCGSLWGSVGALRRCCACLARCQSSAFAASSSSNWSPSSRSFTLSLPISLGKLLSVSSAHLRLRDSSRQPSVLLRSCTYADFSLVAWEWMTLGITEQWAQFSFKIWGSGWAAQKFRNARVFLKHPRTLAQENHWTDLKINLLHLKESQILPAFRNSFKSS